MTEKENRLDNTAENTIYELGYLIVPTVSEENVQGESNKVRDILEGNGSIMSSTDAHRRDLAYTMDKVISNKKNIFDKAYFGSFIFETVAGNIEKIKSELEKDVNVLRFLIMKRTKESLIPPKARVIPKVGTGSSEESSKEGENTKSINEKELDKTIEELVVE